LGINENSALESSEGELTRGGCEGGDSVYEGGVTELEFDVGDPETRFFGLGRRSIVSHRKKDFLK
jgi:hypothetical protein